MDELDRYRIEELAESNGAAVIQLVIPVPRSMLWFGGFFSVVLAGGLVAILWLSSIV